MKMFDPTGSWEQPQVDRQIDTQRFIRLLEERTGKLCEHSENHVDNRIMGDDCGQDENAAE